MKQVLFLLIAVLVFSTDAYAQRKTLDIYFIDVEGGAATLIVTPLGESMLIDSGFAEERDARRILYVAKEVAGLKQIDHCITTHWHRDHVGGITLLAKLIPVKAFYDHGLPTAPANDISPQLIESYRTVSEGKSIALKAGDGIGLLRDRRMPPLSFKIVAANATVVGEEANAPQIKPCGSDFTPIAEDKTDNANSLAMFMSFGSFKFFNGGDLTWNVENKLVCPKNLIGPVDVFQVNHHGVGNSNNPTLVRAIKPRVAIIDNGPRKGGDPKVYATLKNIRDVEAVFQLHKNVASSWNDNAAATFIANVDEKCEGEFIKVSVDESGRKYRVEIPSKKSSFSYQTR